MSWYKKNPLKKIMTTMFFTLELVLIASVLMAEAWIVSFPNDERSNIDSNEIDIEGEPDRLKLIFPGKFKILRIYELKNVLVVFLKVSKSNGKKLRVKSFFRKL